MVVSEGREFDSLEIGQYVVGILHSGRRDTTYKLATLLTLTKLCVERRPRGSLDGLRAPIDDLAEGVIDLYWRQLRAFANGGNRATTGADLVLRQHYQHRALILDAIKELRAVAGAEGTWLPLSSAKTRFPGKWFATVELVGRLMCQEPLRRLQEVPGSAENFPLYDASWMTKTMTRGRIDHNSNMIQLKPGVAAALARLSLFLIPLIENLWVEEALKRNPSIDATYLDVKRHLFGMDTRRPLKKAKRELTAIADGQCFYCKNRVGPMVLDHVLPRWRVGIDGLANLVPACTSCNANKSGLLPAPNHVVRALNRQGLERVATALGWPMEYSRVLGSARGLYLSEPKSPAWIAVGQIASVESLVPLPHLLE